MVLQRALDYEVRNTETENSGAENTDKEAGADTKNTIRENTSPNLNSTTFDKMPVEIYSQYP